MSKFIAQVRTLTVTQWCLGLALVLVIIQGILVVQLQHDLLRANGDLVTFMARIEGMRKMRDAQHLDNERVDAAQEARLSAIEAKLYGHQ